MIGLLPASMLAVAMTKKAAISLQAYCEERSDVAIHLKFDIFKAKAA